MLSNNTIYERTSYQSAIGIAIVAAVFTVVIAAMLAVHVHAMKIGIPARTAELEKMKEQAKLYPADEVLAQRILDTDTQLRRDQFAGLYFVKRGTILLGLTLVLLVGSILWAVSHHPKKPEVLPQGDLKAHQVRQAGLTRTTFSVAVILLCSAALFWVLHAPQADIVPDDTVAVSLYTPMEEMENQWPTFRGPGGLGVCRFENIPDTWDGASGQNILWKMPIPLPGHNSPVAWNDRVFLTGATKDKQQVFCYDADSGKMLWGGDVPIPANPARQDMDIMEDTGYAANTAVTDGKRVCVIFAGGDMGCFAFDGTLLWEKHLGIPESAYGYAASLTAYEKTVIVQWDVGYDEGDESKSKLIALDWQTGNTVWETKRPVPNSWSSPTVVKVAQQYQILTTASPFVIGYDAKTGSELYRTKCLEGDVASTPIFTDNKIIAIEPYNKLVAINASPVQSEGAYIFWENKSDMPDICSPVTNGQFIWTLTTQGLLGCYSVKDGTEVYTHQIKGSFQASPTLVGNKIYLLAEDGTMVIIAGGAEYTELKRNALGEKCYASPAFQDGRIYIRANEHLYAIGAAE